MTYASTERMDLADVKSRASILLSIFVNRYKTRRGKNPQPSTVNDPIDALSQTKASCFNSGALRVRKRSLLAKKIWLAIHSKSFLLVT